MRQIELLHVYLQQRRRDTHAPTRTTARIPITHPLYPTITSTNHNTHTHTHNNSTHPTPHTQPTFPHPQANLSPRQNYSHLHRNAPDQHYTENKSPSKPACHYTNTEATAPTSALPLEHPHAPSTLRKKQTYKTENTSPQPAPETWN